MRRPYKEILSDKIDVFDNYQAPHPLGEETESELLIQEGVENLNEEDQQLLYEYYFDRLSYRQMGNKRGRSHGYVYYRTNRALQRLREQVAANGIHDSSDF